MHARRLVPGAGDVFRIRTGIGVRLRLGAGLSAELEDPVAERTQECAIVRDEEHRAFEVGERRQEHVLGGEIQVVGRLIQHQEVRWLEQHPRHHQTGLLAAGQRADLLVDFVAGELKGAGEVA